MGAATFQRLQQQKELELIRKEGEKAEKDDRNRMEREHEQSSKKTQSRVGDRMEKRGKRGEVLTKFFERREKKNLQRANSPLHVNTPRELQKNAQVIQDGWDP